MTEAQAHETLRELRASVPDDLLNFARAMEAAYHGPAVYGWAYFLTRPEKWAGEYVAWTAAGKPSEFAAEWETFCEGLEALDVQRG